MWILKASLAQLLTMAAVIYPLFENCSIIDFDLFKEKGETPKNIAPKFGGVLYPKH